jgi:hypothetical protein
MSHNMNAFDDMRQNPQMSGKKSKQINQGIV